MTKKKKIIISAIAAVIFLVVVSVGTIFALNLANEDKNNTKTTTPTVKTTQVLRDDAEAARKDNNKTKAKALLTEAKKQLEALPKTDETTNASVDVDAQLFLLDHAK